MVKDPKAVVKQIVNQVGKPEARRLLVEQGISVSTADKIVGERYEYEIGLLIKGAIERALEAAKQLAS